MVSEVTTAAAMVQSAPPTAAKASRPEGVAAAAEPRKSGSLTVVDASKQPEEGRRTEKSKDSQKDLEDAVRSLSERVQNVRRELRFDVDDDAGRMVVKVIDSEKNEVIRQIPAEEVLRLAKRLREMEQEALDPESQGLILRAQV